MLITKGLTTTQLAGEMGVSRQNIYKKVVAGQIPARRMGHSYIISQQDANRIINNKSPFADLTWIDDAVQEIVSEYGQAFKWLSQE